MSSGETWSVRRILDWTINFLKERGSETPRLDAEVLLAHARRCKRIQLYTQYDELLTDDQRAVMRELVRRRGAAEPVAYLVGHREFFSLDFLVRPGVLIPRPDTEIIVMAALDAMKAMESPDVLELCTGTGCIPIAIAKNHRTARLTAVELHPVPLEIARANLEKQQLAGRIALLGGSLFEPVPAGSRFDVIVSNPPYIPGAEIAELDPDVRDHEPRSALDGGPDGLDVIRQIVEQSPRWLKPGGRLILEISPEQAAAVSQLMTDRGFEQTEVKQDLSGQPRGVAGKWENVGELD